MNFLKANKALVAAGIAAAIFLSLSPYLLISLRLGGIPKVIPEFVDDSLFYYARMREVADGHAFIGNPYIYEYRSEPAAAFFVADWISAFPHYVGLSLHSAILFNSVFWIALSALLFLMLCLELRVSSRLAGLGLVMFFAVSFWLMHRPVSMQIVFPFFLFFMIALARWLRDPQKPSAYIALAISLASCFYIYTYLWQIALTSLFFTHVAIAYMRDKKYLTVFWVDAIGIFLAIPAIAYILKQISHPYYWQTMARTGLVATRTFGMSGIYIIAMLAIVLGGIFYSHKKLSPVFIFFSVTGLGLAAASFSNVLSGKDLETAVHVARFVEVWFAVGAVYLFSSRMAFAPKIILAILVGIVIGRGGYYTAEKFSSVLQYDARAESYAPVLAWLEAESVPSVVDANESIGLHIPVMTKHYVLFNRYAELYLMPDGELEDRYLLSRHGRYLSPSEIESNYRLFAGVGNAVHAHKTHNREVRICRLIKFWQSEDCGEIKTLVSYKGQEYFDDLSLRSALPEYKSAGLLEKYGVRYIVRDIKSDAELSEEYRKNLVKKYDDGRFVVYYMMYSDDI